MGRILAVDYGTKNVGLACTDPLQLSLNTLAAIEAKNFKSWIEKYLSQEDIEIILFGYPTHADGTKTKLCKQIDKHRDFLLKNFNDVEIKYVDESFSSKDAEIIMLRLGIKKGKRKEKGTKDSYSAVVILSEYLESIK